MLRTRRIVRESRAYGQALMRPMLSNDRFLIFAQGRTGTWLLFHMLNLHPQIYCEKEILMDKVQWPYWYTQGRSCRRPRKVYGCHIQINQLLNTQSTNPAVFVHRLAKDGWKIIYLKREDIIRQSISTMIATQKRQWYTKQGETLEEQKYYINPEELLTWLTRRVDHYAREEDILKDMDHLTLSYEDNLLSKTQHQSTMDQVFTFIGVPTIPVEAPTKRLSSDCLSEVILNFEEVDQWLRTCPFAKYYQPC